MKKVDLHVHSLPSRNESTFVFSVETLKDYVDNLKLNAIAITNHNFFDITNFDIICSELGIPVFPGVEVDIEKGHMLVIAPFDEKAKFKSQCDELEKLIIDPEDYITKKKFIEIFNNYKDYLLIPHYKKHKALPISVIEYFNDDIHFGEVKNAGVFIKTKKESNSLVPLLFSDFRCTIKDNKDNKKSKYENRFTFVDIEDITIKDIKLAFSNKNKVFLTDEKNDEEITIFQDGTTASSRLNVVLGKRATGKSYLLNTIESSYEDGEEKKSVQYIPQFYISSNSKDENFEKELKKDYSNIAETFLFPLKKLINEILTIDIDKTNTELKDYIEILYNHANTSIDSDHVARLPLFNASTYNYSSNIELQDLIFAVNKIIDTKIYKETIEKYIPNLTNLKNLYIDLVSKWEKEKKEEKAKKVVDDMITVLKGALSPKSKVTATKDIDLVKIYKEKKIIKKFDNLINSLKMEMELPNLKQSFKGYNILVSKGVFNSASEIIGSFTLPKVGIKDDFDKYYESEPSRYLQGIYEKGIPEPMLHRLLIKMPIEATDSTNTPVSGGQKAEIILLKKIENAKKYDILLIDEPESSFDNEFIMNNIIPQIEELADKTTVFISTHNNTLGVSIKSDKIIYTAKTGKNEYDIFTGTNQSSKLSSVSGKELKSYETILGTMEAGSIAYKGRKEIYENLGDKK